MRCGGEVRWKYETAKAVSEDRVEEVCWAWFWSSGYADIIWLAGLGLKSIALHYTPLVGCEKCSWRFGEDIRRTPIQEDCPLT